MTTLDTRAIPQRTQVAVRWVEKRTVTPDQVPPLEILRARKRAERLRISVGVTAFNDAATIGHICRVIRRELMTEVPFVDELVVLDSESVDDTVLRARSAGAHVLNVNELMPEVPSYPGKGDSLWKSLTALSGDIVVWLNADIRNFAPHFVTRLVAPLLVDPTVGFVKGYYERPTEIDVEIDDVLYIAGDGHMTELLARPLLTMLFPELGGFFEPLAGEYAGRMDLFRRIPFFSGWSVDVATLIDVFEEIGLDGMAQVDLGPRVAGNRTLEDLGPRAYTTARTILARAQERKRIKLSPNASSHPLLVPHGGTVDPLRIDDVERPPIDIVPPYIEALRNGAGHGERRGA
jgi:glucosyl-3-phosphoglycerate synthase